MLPEYDFSGAVRGKYAKRYAEGTNCVLLSAEVATFFPDSVSVNRALKSLIKLGRAKKARRASRGGGLSQSARGRKQGSRKISK
jgi:hypothetical protein